MAGMLLLQYALLQSAALQVVKELKRSEYKPRMAVLVGGWVLLGACWVMPGVATVPLHVHPGCPALPGGLAWRARGCSRCQCTHPWPVTPPALPQGSRKHYCVNMHATKQSSIDEACEELLKESQVGAGRWAKDLLKSFHDVIASIFRLG